jgi:hypothetical protein
MPDGVAVVSIHFIHQSPSHLQMNNQLRFAWVAGLCSSGRYQILSVARTALLKVYLRYCVSNVRAYLTLFTHTDIFSMPVEDITADEESESQIKPNHCKLSSYIKKHHLRIACLTETHGTDGTCQLFNIQLLLAVRVEEIEHLLYHVQLTGGTGNAQIANHSHHAI